MTPAAQTSEPRTPDWDEFACDGEKCGCHDPFICSTCGCTHNEAEAAALPASPDVVEALEAAEFALNITVAAESDDRSWYDEACEALETVRAALAALPAAPAGLDAQLVEARKAIESEIAMASDPEGKDQFEQGALAAYHFALSVLPDAAYAEGEPHG